MSSARLWQICLITSCTNPLLKPQKLNHIVRARYINKKTRSGRSRHRRANSAPSSPYHRRRRSGASSQTQQSPHIIQELRRYPKPCVPAAMASLQLRRAVGSPKQDSPSLDAILASSGSEMEENLISFPEDMPSSPIPPPSRHVGLTDSSPSQADKQTDFTLQPWRSSMPPNSNANETFGTRSTRSLSSASRNTNRLSLTLPIAPPTSMPSKPTPSSVPPTPYESGLSSPTNSSEFIIAIAAQERRVLELRDELRAAEDELSRLKKQWKSSEGYKMKPSYRNNEPLRPLVSTADEGSVDSPSARRSAQMDKKKALFLSQGTPREHRRKVFSGHHTRALSLLSPTTSESGHILSDRDADGLRSPSASEPTMSPNPLRLSKRATWTPRQSQQPLAKQIAEDFKYGLWTFVEDLRQATVGDEGISATSNRTSDFNSRVNRFAGDQETIRASSTNRGRIPLQPELLDDAPSISSSGSFHDRTRNQQSGSKVSPKTRKHFSWTPLTFDDLGDDDWSNWDSPPINRTARWSGSTVNGDIIPALPEKNDDNEGTLRRKPSRSELRTSSPNAPATLGELPAALLNTLTSTPSNIKRFSSDFMKEWEKSLSPPAEVIAFEPSFQSIKHKTP